MRSWTQRLISAVALVTLTLTAWPAAQDRPPQRDVRRTPATGTAVISGTLVTDDSSPRPIRRAAINLSGSDFIRRRMTVTDDAGRFQIANLPAASYSVWASKPGYVTAYYGGKRPGRGPGLPIALGDGQQVTLALKMLRGEPFKREASIAKLYSSEIAMENARAATQVHGGYGFMNEFPVARFYRDAKILEIGEGTSEVQRMLIARDLGVG